ncbi:hypothetical protein GLYMA_13G070450v4 [Glycine max]|nr:hypothetical protein GLYMA_13G070450v4 [Glycine max]KAH1100221.1 hypothetical protein GYH30_035399 [Glycine max]
MIMWFCHFLECVLFNSVFHLASSVLDAGCGAQKVSKGWRVTETNLTIA